MATAPDVPLYSTQDGDLVVTDPDHDAWWDFEFEGSQLTAWSYSSYEVAINLETGARDRQRWTH